MESSNQYQWYNFKSVRGMITMLCIVLGSLILLSSTSSYMINEKTKEEVDFISEQRVPVALASLNMKADIYESVSHLRGFVITHNRDLIQKRKDVYTKRIFPNLIFLVKAKRNFTNPINISRVDSITNMITNVKSYQDEVEELVLQEIKTALQDSNSIQRLAILKVQIKKIIIDKLNPELSQLNDVIDDLSSNQSVLLQKGVVSLVSWVNLQQMLILLISLLGLGLSVFLSIFITNNILDSLMKLKNHLIVMATGVLPERMDVEANEIGEMADACNKFINELYISTKFANEIGRGKFDTDVKPSTNDLGKALYKMRDNLKLASIEEQKRAWTTDGLAKFGEILRTNDVDFEKLSNAIISNLVKYVNANQGGLYIINEANQEESYIELQACYAWEKKRFIHQKIYQGEGLVGQAWQEKDVVLLTEIPENFIRITSGLGDASPNCILIVPMCVNDEIYGVLELASFNVFDKYEIEFIKKLTESIASTIASAKMNERTKWLLECSQHQTEELRAQEEEMRQNIEEMQATQEEMERKDKEMRYKVNDLNKEQEVLKNMQKTLERLNELYSSLAIVSKTDLRGIITYVNDMFCFYSKYTKEELIGKPQNIVRHPDMPSEAFTNLWATIKSGRIWRGEVKNRSKDGTSYWVDAVVAPLFDSEGNINEYISIRYPINEKKDLIERVKELEKRCSITIRDKQA